MKLGGPKSSAQLNKPNVSYKINVESVENRGYATIEEALVNYQPGTGVVCRVTLLDDFHELVANGQYYLGLSNSEFCFYADGEQNDIIVTTVTTMLMIEGMWHLRLPSNCLTQEGWNW